MTSDSKTKVMIIAVAALIGALQFVSSFQTASAGDFVRITKLKQFKTSIVGKTLTKPNNRFVVAADGTWGGTASGKKASGTWKWRRGYWCRIGTLGSNLLAEDCQEISVSGNKVRLKRNRGSGEVVQYKIGG